jgi:hypothetical protein
MIGLGVVWRIGGRVEKMTLTYGPKCHNGHTASSLDVWLVCDRESYFHQPAHSPCFLVIELCFGRNRTDNRSFLSIRG